MLATANHSAMVAVDNHSVGTAAAVVLADIAAVVAAVVGVVGLAASVVDVILLYKPLPL